MPFSCLSEVTYYRRRTEILPTIFGRYLKARDISNLPPLRFCSFWFLPSSDLGRISRVEPVQLSVPGNLEQKSSSSGAPARKKKSIGIRALSAKQRKDDHIKALLKEHLSEIRALLRREVPVGVEVGNNF